ncbi:hypothetical protein [Citrobacter freundii]|uniref:hypothetical protein n=1 Tax=Citrobacter freundii TaxID=546 RepID=UPI0023AEB11F|nr:hypothetical protein [Citrobacter freundii]
MSYERQNSTRLEQYRARQAERIDTMNRAIEAGQTTVVASSSENSEPVCTPYGAEIKSGIFSFAAGPAAAVAAMKVLFEDSTPKFRDRSVVRHFGFFTDLIPGARGRKSPTAVGVESAIRPRFDVRAAALSSGEPRDGQLFSYDASTGRMVPVNERDVAQRIRVHGRPRRHNLTTVRNK